MAFADHSLPFSQVVDLFSPTAIKEVRRLTTVQTLFSAETGFAEAMFDLVKPALNKLRCHPLQLLGRRKEHGGTSEVC